MRNEFTFIEGSKALETMVRILQRYDVGRLGLKGGDFPYVIPMNHTYHDGRLLLHGSYTGRKIDLLTADPRACYEVDGPKEGAEAAVRSCHQEYESVLCYGTIRIVTEPELKAAYLSRLQAGFGQPALTHADVARCNAFVFEIKEMTGRTGRFRPTGERPLYVFRFTERAPEQPQREDDGPDGQSVICR